MEKYLNAVLLEPEIKTARHYYLSACKHDCMGTTKFFGYDESFLAICQEKCSAKHRVFLRDYNSIQNQLKKGIQKCMDKHTGETVGETYEKKQCILQVQEKAFSEFDKALDKLNSH